VPSSNKSESSIRTPRIKITPTLADVIREEDGTMVLLRLWRCYAQGTHSTATAETDTHKYCTMLESDDDNDDTAAAAVTVKQ
jgi:hypothetical protein